MVTRQQILEVLLFMPGFLFSLSWHEAAHGWVADKFGDPTARKLGRITLNPIPHTDPIGTLALPIFGLLFGGFLFGWGKPVPVDYRNFKNPRRDMMYVAVAGPASNLILAVIFGVVVRLFLHVNDDLYGKYLAVTGGTSDILAQISATQLFGMINDTLVGLVFLNLAMCLFNLVPVDPLDGGKILFGLLPLPMALKISKFTSRYGGLILLLLIMSGGLRAVMWPPIYRIGTLILGG